MNERLPCPTQGETILPGIYLQVYMVQCEFLQTMKIPHFLPQNGAVTYICKNYGMLIYDLVMCIVNVGTGVEESPH
jgi:hypothetical protein